MGSTAKKMQKPSGEVVFAEERRVPLSNEARDAFLAELDHPAAPNAALKQAARRYKRATKATPSRKKK